VAPAIFNAANEVAVEAFLQERVGFLEMPQVVDAVLQRMGHGSFSSVEEVLDWDRQAREAAVNEIERRSAANMRKN
jgi:1-deoxy-D-xylulose-5-phosphate reductoisomerase